MPKVKPNLGLKVLRLPDFSESLAKKSKLKQTQGFSIKKTLFAEKRSKGKPTLYHVLQLVGKNVGEATVLKAL